jgi:hypothetical protein
VVAKAGSGMEVIADEAPSCRENELPGEAESPIERPDPSPDIPIPTLAADMRRSLAILVISKHHCVSCGCV